jgi:hypothetical protein
VPRTPAGPGPSGPGSSAGPAAAPATGHTASTGSSQRAQRVATTRTRFSSRGPAARRGTVIRFRLRAPGTVELVVRTALEGGCALIGRRQTPGHAGVNHVRFAGRVKGHPLAVGKYTITVVVVRGTHRTRVGTVAVEVVPPNRRLTPAQRTASVHAEPCVGAANDPSAPAALLAAGAPLAAGTGGSSGSPGEAQSRPGGTSPVHGPAFKPPRLAPATSGIGGGVSRGWLPFTVYALLGLIVAAALVQLTRFFRGTWTP